MTRPPVMRVRRAAPEKRLQWEIRRALEMLGFDVTSTSQPQRAMMTAGIPDLYARHPRWQIRLWIEVKTPRGRVRPAQAAWIEAERAAGGLAIIAPDQLEARHSELYRVASRLGPAYFRVVEVRGRDRRFDDTATTLSLARR